jgi:hypothetical protein
MRCQICGFEDPHSLVEHIQQEHGMSVSAYLNEHKGASVVSQKVLSTFKDQHKVPKRTAENLLSPEIKIAGVPFKVHTNVPPEACLPLPDHYKVPMYGDLGEDVYHAAISIKKCRSTYIYGLQGSGKDSFVHAVSALTRQPAIIRAIQPGRDIQSWFYSRSFSEKGTYWEEGPLLTALKDGYTAEDGEVIPYIVLISDLDRATKEQAEHMRLILDSIQGRVETPTGVHSILPGTLILATGNSCGAGDERGRAISANPMDSSIIDRFDAVLEFHWMSWKDEVAILKNKFPFVFEKFSKQMESLEDVTGKLRKAILDDEIYCEFSHRALCHILQRVCDMAEFEAATPKCFTKALTIWLASLPDRQTKESAKAYFDPLFKTIKSGDSSNFTKEDLADGWLS